MSDVSNKVTISDRSISFIVAQEVSDQSYYERTEEHFDWPGGASGATVGIGYDLGYVTAHECKTDWDGIVRDETINAMLEAIGITGNAAHMFVAARHDEVTITWGQAVHEFTDREIPKWEDRCRKALPNFDLLSPDCAGAIVSLTYNRGDGGYHSTLPRYREMATIHDLMAQGRWSLIPAQINDMARLWPNSTDLRRRRALEANLFAGGVKDCKKLSDQPGVVVMNAPANQTEQPPHPATAPGAPTTMQTTPGTSAPGGQPDIIGEIESALTVAENELPTLLGVLSMFMPQLKAVIPFLNLLPVAIQAVDTVHKAIAPSGGTPQAAVAQVVNTLTPGQPGAPALN